MRTHAATASLLLWLAGCTAGMPAGDPPAGFDPLAFFTGRTRSEGVVDLAFSKPDSFTTDIRGVKQDGELLLIQHFTYGDGHSEDRVWHLRHLDPEHLTGVANDVVGSAGGVVHGNTLRLRYALATQPGNWLRNVAMDQVMVLQPDGSMSNRVSITKLGLPLGTVTERFTHVPG